MPALLTKRQLASAGRRGSLPLQDLIRVRITDVLDQQILRVGAGRCAGPSDVKFIRAAGRHGSLPLQDLIRVRITDVLDQQILCVGAGRCAGPRVMHQVRIEKREQTSARAGAFARPHRSMLTKKHYVDGAARSPLAHRHR